MSLINYFSTLLLVCFIFVSVDIFLWILLKKYNDKILCNVIRQEARVHKIYSKSVYLFSNKINRIYRVLFKKLFIYLNEIWFFQIITWNLLRQNVFNIKQIVLLIVILWTYWTLGWIYQKSCLLIPLNVFFHLLLLENSFFSKLQCFT